MNRVAVIQMNSTGDVDRNLGQADELVSVAASEGAKLIALPECFAYLGREEGKLELVEPLPEGGPILERCQSWARQHRVELVLGGFWERGADPKHCRNASVLLRADGSVGAIYRKIHLFDVDLPDGTRVMESDTQEPGNEIVVAETAVGKVGLSICYDVRFPELYRKLVDAGATILSVPAAFTATTGKAHWHTLLRARAIESQCFLMAAAQVGHHFGKRYSFGHAQIIDPWGEVLAKCDGEGPGYAVANLDFDRLEEVRRTLPALKHRRL